MQGLALFFFPIIYSAPSYAQYDGPNPGSTGAYAFLFLDHAQEAKISRLPRVDVKTDFLGRDRLGKVQGVVLSLLVPFGDAAELEVVSGVDTWNLSPSVVERYELEKSRGHTGGDVIIRTKLRVLGDHGDPLKPTVAILINLKTPAGDFKQARRYTDSSAYELAVTFSKALLGSSKSALRLRGHLEAGFAVWDTGPSEQNDAYKVAARVQGSYKKFKFSAGFLGFYGWQDSAVDHVSLLRLEGGWLVVPNLDVYGQVNLGLSQAALEHLAGLGFRYNIPKKIS